MNQEDQRNRLLIELDSVTREVRDVVDGLSPEQLAWSPNGRWSMAQIVEHLIVASDRYFGRIRGRIFAPRAAHVLAESEIEWEPSLTGWWLVRRLRATRPLPAPRMFLPEAPRQDLVDAFVQRQKTLTYLLRASSALYWNRVTASSPVNTLLRFNIGDAFSILVVHEQRHAVQLMRLRELDAFPKEPALH